MATRSTIAIENADGTVEQIYCHWDGYLSNNGMLLQTYYTDPAKVRQLIDLGDISSLRPEIGEKHPFDTYSLSESEKAKYENWTTAYGRDRGEDGVAAKRFRNFADYKKNHQYEEYEYILRKDGVWYVSTGSVYASLTDAIAQENEEDYA